MTVHFAKRRDYGDDADDALNLDVAPLADLVEAMAIALREMFGARSPGNYRWVGNPDHPVGDPELSEVMITETDHMVEDLVDRFPVLAVTIAGSRGSGFDRIQGDVAHPVTNERLFADLLATPLIIRSCSSVGTESLRLAEYVKGYLLVFRDFLHQNLGIHDIGGASTLSGPFPSARIEGASTRKWTETAVTVPLQVEFSASYEYSRASAFRLAMDRVTIAIVDRMGESFTLESGD